MDTATALAELRERLAAIANLDGLTQLASWDQQTHMPDGAAAARADQLATIERICHERRAAPEIGELIGELESRAGELGDLDRDLVRIARRDYDHATAVPADLSAELARAGAEGQQRWAEARSAGDAALLTDTLARNVRLAREYASCLTDGDLYDALVGLYDHGVTAARIDELFAPLRARLPELVARAGEGPPSLEIAEPVQRRAVASVLARVGADPAGWAIDDAAHPFTASPHRTDIRLTTRYDDGGVQSLLAGLHEFGHGLYEAQSDPALDGTGLAGGTSMAVHESQSKLWEDSIGRHPAFCRYLARELTAAGHVIDGADLHRAVTAVAATPIRVTADPVSFPLHVIVRFDLERALIGGELEATDLAEAFRARVQDLLGIELADDREGVLQDVHWPSGAFGYFPSYAVGAVIAAQLWEHLTADLGASAGDGALAEGEVGAIREWLGERIHRVGRRRDTEELVRSAIGEPLAADAFLRAAERAVAGEAG